MGIFNVAVRNGKNETSSVDNYTDSVKLNNSS